MWILVKVTFSTCLPFPSGKDGQLPSEAWTEASLDWLDSQDLWQTNVCICCLLKLDLRTAYCECRSICGAPEALQGVVYKGIQYHLPKGLQSEIGQGVVGPGVVAQHTSQSFQSSFLIMDIATYRLNQPRGQCSENHVKCITR